MKLDPAHCHHKDIQKSVKLETVSVPELEIEQLVLRIRIRCKSCGEPFVPKTMALGFSTEEVGLVGDDLLIPLEYPQAEETDEPEGEQLTPEMEEERPPKAYLH